MRGLGKTLLLALVAAALFSLPAQAASVHPTQTDSFGSNGLPGGSLPGVNQLAVDKDLNRLFVLGTSEKNIQAFDIPNAATHTTVGPPFPIVTPSEGGGDPDIGAETPDGTLWRVSESPNELVGYDSGGNILAGFPITTGFADPCGGAVDGNGNMWVANFNTQTLQQFNSGGRTGETINAKEVGNFCHVEFDRSTNDLYVANWNGGGVHKFDAASGYTQHTLIDNENAQALAFDATSHVLYVAHSNSVKAYNESGALLETFATSGGSHNYQGIAVNENTGVVYVADAAQSKVLVFGSVIVPDVTTGPPVENEIVSGTVDPAGGPEVTSCKVEYGLTSAYSGFTPIACEPGTPYTSAKNITATLTGMTGETTYHYRVVAANANGTNFGADRTITPHFVKALKTENPINVTRVCATLKGSYVGDGSKDVTYQFKWGTTTAYGNVSPAEPVNNGKAAGPQSVTSTICGLTPATTYHYKIVASNVDGASVAEDVAFTTVTSVEFLKTEPATNVEAQSATLNGSWTGNGEDTHYYFEWGKTTAYGNVTSAPPGIDKGALVGPVAVSFNLTGLDPSATYHYRIVAQNAVGQTKGNDVAFTTTTSLPLVREFSSDIHSESAVLNAEINPGGIATTFHFEYGPDDCSSNPCTSVPETEVNSGAGNVFSRRSVHIEGLEPATTYHFRVVATNALGSSSYDEEFTTFDFIPDFKDQCGNLLARQQTGAGLLLDCRAYEIVSAVNTGGYDVESNLVPGQQPFQGYPDANDPPRVLYGVNNGAIPGVAGHPTNKGVDPYVATRSDTGWSTAYLGVPANNPNAAGPFSSVPSGADDVLGTLAFGAAGGCSPCFPGGYTGIPVRLPNGQLVQGMVGSEDPGPSAEQDGLVAQRLSGDGTHLVFGSTSQFEGDGNSNGDVSIYSHDLTSGETHVVSKAPGGGNLACLQGAGKCNSAEGNGDAIAELAISEDGSRVLVAQKVAIDGKGNRYWHLYMNVDGDDETIDVTPGANNGVLFAGMTDDGGTVFFTTKDQITGAGDGDNSADLYQSTVGTTSATVSRITTIDSDGCDPVFSGNGAQPHWNSVGVAPTCNAVAIGGGGGVGSADGSVYFLSPEQLDGSEGIVDEPNLYVAAPGGSPAFIGTLDPDDTVVRNAIAAAETRHMGDFQTNPGGRFAVFGTTLSLTGYANSGHNEVFRYDRDEDELDCASCSPTNSKAEADAGLSEQGLSITDLGQVFFDSDDALALRDSDNVRDAYEWEPAGVGDCDSAGPSYSVGNDSCTNLISSGISPFDSKLLGASRDGHDVYFFTHDSLAEQDENGPIIKIYDARVDGGFFVIPDPALCAASDECHGPSSPVPGPPDIKTVTGNVGNVTPKKACPKGKVRRNGKCVKKKKGKAKNKKNRRHHRGSGR